MLSLLGEKIGIDQLETQVLGSGGSWVRFDPSTWISEVVGYDLTQVLGPEVVGYDLTQVLGSQKVDLFRLWRFTIQF